MKKRISIQCLLLIILLTGIHNPGSSQEKASMNDSLRKGALNLFIDCDFCDMNYVRQEIPFVNYVRDTREAEVYLLVTSQHSGNGGHVYTLVFQGHGKFSGMNDTLLCTSNPDESSTIIREDRTHMIKMGLMRYVARTPLYTEIEFSHNSSLIQEEIPDRWNNWVFEISTEPVLQAEETNTELDFRNSLNIRKITDRIKLETEIDNFYNRERFIQFAGTDSSEVTTYVRRSRSIYNLFVLSVGDHLSAGVRWDLGSSTRNNYNFTTGFIPSVEYDIFPYSQSTHRQLRILYGAGIQYNNYNDSTIFNLTSEILGRQSLNIAFQVKKKWGSINVALEGSSFLHDLSKNRIELSSFMEFRIFKGLSLRIEGDIAHLNDQLNLRKGEISDAERLLKLTEMATRYQFEGGIEISYTFGSIYNNVVNPRFGN